MGLGQPDRLRVSRRMRRGVAWLLLTLGLGLGGAIAPGGLRAQAPAGGAGQAAGAGGLSPEVIAQIDAIEREKAARTPAERKVDSQLLYALRAAQGLPAANGVASLQTDVAPDASGRVTVDITAQITPALQADLAGRGANVLSAPAGTSSLRATITLDQVLAIAARPDVIWVQPRQRAFTMRRAGDAGVARRAQRITTNLRAALARDQASAAHGTSPGGGSGPRTSLIGENTGQGSRSSEGDLTHRAFQARKTYGVDGTGVKIGVLSDGVFSLADSQASGDLGVVHVLPGQGGGPGQDEGTAMLEIIHDLAPGAELYFATAFTSITSFAQNIRDLRAAGCDIIVDDVSYYAETAFQDGQTGAVASTTNGGVVVEAVNDVTADGALYFSSAANSGNLNDGTSGTWEGDFVAAGVSGAPVPVTADLHDFGGGVTFDVLTATSDGPITLQWSDPLGASTEDYDLFVLNSTGTLLIDSSTNIQDGTQDPYEEIGAQTSGHRIVIVRTLGAAARFLHLSSNRGVLAIGTSGETHGHSQAALAYSVAATPAAASFDGPNPGPFPNAFTTANAVETFSSDGPRRIFFHADSAAITPGNLLAGTGGGLLRQKPDITAADGTTVTGAGGFASPFYGTSAAAPHAAAIAALIKQAKPALTPAQIRTALVASALDIEAPGVDRDAGAGIVMADAALQAAGATGGAGLVLDSFTASDHPGNGDGIIVGGEGGQITVALANVGIATATAVSATLTTTTPGVTITQPAARAYPDIAIGATGSHATPFFFTVPSDTPCAFTIDFTLTVTFSGGVSSPMVLTFSLPIGASLDITTTLDGTAPAVSPLYAATTGTQTGRISRNGVASTCGTPAANPGLTTAVGLRQYDAYAIATCPALATGCTTVTLESANGINLYAAAYQPSFNPATPSTNFLGDAGFSDTSTSFGVKPSGSAFTVVVHDINVVPASGSAYRLRVSGICAASCTRNGVPTAIAQNRTVIADATGTANASINNGSTDPDADALTITQSSAGPYPVGVNSVLLTVTDPQGATSQATATVTVLPSITLIAPATGSSIGGTVVTITGTGFSIAPGATTVKFGAVVATAVTCASVTTCQATSPAGAGTVSVRVTVIGATSADTAADDFIYIPAPTVTAIDPASGPLGGGTVVTITGTGFSIAPGATTIMFGAQAATVATCASVTQCQATSPAGASTGTVSVRVTVGGQTSADTPADDFSYATLAYLLAEGATGGFFDEDVLIANPNLTAAPISMQFFKEDGTTVTDTRTLAAQSRTTVHVDALPGLEATAASVQVTSESGVPLAVERSMFWDSTYYGGHTAGAVAGPGLHWAFAEGSQGFFDTYLLVVNANATPASVTVTFLLEGDAPVTQVVPIGAASRLTLWAGSIPALVNRSFGITVDATQPVIVERAMYFGSTPTRLWSGGHASGGSTPALQWFYAEGATGGFFDTFLLLSNPQDAEAHVDVRYLLDSGEVIAVPKLVPAHGRLTVNVETEADARLQNAAFSMRVTSDVPIVSERSMYWPGAVLPWGEAHNSAGITELGTAWALAEGRVGGAHNFHTFILLGNPQSTAAQVTVTYLRENGAVPIVKTYTVPPTQRFNIDVNTVVPELVNESFGARIEVTNGVEIIVERSMYWDANGIFWSGGSNATGIRLPSTP
jgi:hypothetical protein